MGSHDLVSALESPQRGWTRGDFTTWLQGWHNIVPGWFNEAKHRKFRLLLTTADRTVQGWRLTGILKKKNEWVLNTTIIVLIFSPLFSTVCGNSSFIFLCLVLEQLEGTNIILQEIMSFIYSGLFCIKLFSPRYATSCAANDKVILNRSAITYCPLITHKMEQTSKFIHLF